MDENKDGRLDRDELIAKANLFKKNSKKGKKGKKGKKSKSFVGLADKIENDEAERMEVDEVLKKFDLNKDGTISMREW